LKGHTEGVTFVVFSGDGKTLASGSASTVKLWDVVTGQGTATLHGKMENVSCKTFSPDGRTLALGSSDGTVKLWDVVTGQERTILKGHSDKVYAMTFSGDGKLLASAGGGLRTGAVYPASLAGLSGASRGLGAIVTAALLCQRRGAEVT